MEKYNDDDDNETAEYWNDSSIYAFDAELSDVTAVVPVTDVEMQVEEEGGVVEEAQEEEEEEVDSGAASAVFSFFTNISFCSSFSIFTRKPIVIL